MSRVAILIVGIVILLSSTIGANAQAIAERAELEAKMARMDLAGPPQPMHQGLVWPSEQTARRPYFGYRLIVGAPYEPSISPRDTWIYIGCISADPRVAWDDDDFGSSLVYVHALIYEMNRDGSLNTDTLISTAETDETDEAICDLQNGIDTSFLEIPRNFDAAVVSLFSIGRRTQYVEVVENIERTLPQ